MKKAIDVVKVNVLYGRVRTAFRSLRKKHIAARMDFKCCMSCATYAAPKDSPFVYFHHQDKEYLFEDGHSLMIRYCTPDGKGTGALANIVVGELKDAGVTVEWDEDINKCIVALVHEEEA